MDEMHNRRLMFRSSSCVTGEILIADQAFDSPHTLARRQGTAKQRLAGRGTNQGAPADAAARPVRWHHFRPLGAGSSGRRETDM